MFSIAQSKNTVSQKKFKKFGKQMKKQRQKDLNRMKSEFSKITEREKKRSQEIFESHKEFFTDKPSESQKVEMMDHAIDFYET
mgnify:CR=1 FL=1